MRKREGSDHELLGIRPGLPGEALDGDHAAAVELPPVDDVRGLLAALGDDQLGAEALGRHPELRQPVLLKHRHLILLTLVSILFRYPKSPRKLAKN